MTLSKRCKTIRFGLSLLLFTLPLACATGLKKDIHPMLNDVKSIAVFPFVCMDCPGSLDGQGGQSAGWSASPVMTDHLVKRFKERTDLDVSLLPGISREEIKSIFSDTTKLGHSIQKDAVFLGRIFHYKNRTGGDYSVSEPSSVAFDMRIIRVSDGQILFYSEFDETQKPLLSNIMNIGTFVKREGKWIEAEDMAKTAMDESLKEFFMKP